MLFIGIDPGLSGAIAVINENLEVISLEDTPTLQVKKTRREYDLRTLAGILAFLNHLAEPWIAFIEESQAMPRQGVRSSFTIGVGFGIWLGMLGAFEIPYQRIRPHVWKKYLNLTKDKEMTRLRAMQLFPKAELHLKKHHNRAEALLLAYYGFLQMDKRNL